MAVDHPLVRTDAQRDFTLSSTVVVFSMTALNRLDVTASTQDIHWQWGDKSSGGLTSGKRGIIKAGATYNIPMDPDSSRTPDDPWYVSIVRVSADTVVTANGYNQAPG